MQFDWTELSFSGVSERIWRIFLLIITGMLVFLTYYCVSRGITTIFMHLYYYPIIIFAYRYQKKGVACSALLGMTYVLMVVYFNPSNLSEVIGAIERFITFMGVALIIAYLSIHLKRRQSEIQRLSQFQENIISNAQVWLTVLDKKGTILVWNKAAADLSGYQPEEVIGKNTIWKQLYPDLAYRKNITSTINRIIDENKYFEHFESTILTKNGDLKVISWNTRAIPDETGMLFNFVAIGTDITERTQAEKALKESEARYSALFYHNNTVSLLIDPDTGMIVDANTAACTYYGYTREKMTGLRIFDLNRLPQEKVLRDLSVAKNAGEKHFFSNHFLANGERRNVEIFSGPITVKSKPLFYSIIHDITDRKKAEEAVKESEARLNSILHGSPVPQFVIDRAHRVISWNEALEKYSGLKYEDVIGTSEQWKAFYIEQRPCLADFLVDEAIDQIPKWYKDKIRKSRFVDGAYEAIDFFPKMGESGIWLHFTAAAIRDSKGIVIGAVETLEDITERKQAEEALLREMSFTDAVFDSVPGLIYVFDEQGNLVQWNKKFEENTGYSSEDLAHMHLLDWFAGEDKARIEKAVQTVFVNGRAAVDADMVIKDGRKIPFYFTGVRMTIGDTMYLIGVGMDITERKMAEERLRSFNEELERGIAERTAKINASLQEKVVLLREIHHRVKNNLQIVISLLNLQTRQIPDENVKKMMQESQNRIKVMALVHEKLYRSEDISHIILSEFIRNLITILLDFYLLDRSLVTAKVEMKDITLNIDTAIPIGLMINELVSNSFKHAFPEGRKGEIAISVQKADHTLTILYKDNGVGIPEGFDWRNTTSLGLRLVISLVEQLSGTIELNRNQGTEFIIIVKEKEK